MEGYGLRHSIPDQPVAKTAMAAASQKVPKPSTLAYSLLEARLIMLRNDAIAAREAQRVAEFDELVGLVRNFAALLASERRGEA